MNIKKLATIIVAALLAANSAFGQTVSMTGQVTALSDTRISLLCGSDTWNIKRTATTSVTNRTLAVGNTVTVQCLSTDVVKIPGSAQKKEEPQ